MSKIDWENHIRSFYYEMDTEYSLEDLYQAFKERMQREYKINSMKDFVKEQVTKPIANAEFSTNAIYSHDDDEQAEGE